MPIFRKDGKNILFIHIPKTGGSAVERVFKNSGYESLYLDGKVGRGTVNHLRRCTPQHMHGAMLQQNFRLSRFDAIFMIVRDPLARLRSEYVWRNRNKEVTGAASDVERWSVDAFAAYRRDNFLYDNHIRPQADFFVPGARVYYFENGLPEAIADLDSSFELGLVDDIPRVRTAKAHGLASSAVQISPELRRRVMSFYRDDYVRFGYDSEGVPTKPATEPFSVRARRALARRLQSWARG
ncbi:sulfotransferase family 2 domain-containing protein [Microbacterium sp. STN6]|uniref:sulfotransferase family 2 domain-containing protein n=1 Tax=Microbacterium sp. STN6 TaxID=2995588 RepID=UPI002260C6FE|nr:sulfotransferase family 2 domain-containing protein [Microbacterium sp. STN6]MCX7521856.1 sulfotransferase family 2 domain-containing protein [Microbacterium sp. STN6]